MASQPVDAVTSGRIAASIVMSDGFLEHLGPSGIYLSMSVVLPETAKKLAAIHAQHHCAYVEAPIFGRPEATVAQKL